MPHDDDDALRPLAQPLREAVDAGLHVHDPQVLQAALLINEVALLDLHRVPGVPEQPEARPEEGRVPLFAPALHAPAAPEVAARLVRQVGHRDTRRRTSAPLVACREGSDSRVCLGGPDLRGGNIWYYSLEMKGKSGVRSLAVVS